MCALLITAEIKKFITVTDYAFPLLFKQGFELSHILYNDRYGNAARTHYRQDFVKVIGQADIGKFVHKEMNRYRQCTLVDFICRVEQKLKEL